MLKLSDLCDAMVADGLIVDFAGLNSSGKLTRCGTTIKPRSKNGWYVIYINGDFINAKYMAYGIHDAPIKWHSRNKDTLSKAERQQIYANTFKLRQQQEQERIELLVNLRANYSKWVKPLSGSHPYLDKKGVAIWLQMSIAYPLGVTPWGNLVIPVQNIAEELMGYQEISINGTKKFATGSQKKGNFYLIAPAGISLADADRIFIAEGLATGLSAYITLNELLDAFNFVILVAFDVLNITNVVDSVWSKCPEKPITLIADNDDVGTDKNIGLDNCNAIVTKHQGRNINTYAPGAFNI